MIRSDFESVRSDFEVLEFCYHIGQCFSTSFCPLTLFKVLFVGGPYIAIRQDTSLKVLLKEAKGLYGFSIFSEEDMLMD